MDGIRSYRALPLRAKVLEWKIREPTAVMTSLDKQLEYLRDEWRKATTKARRRAIEVEAEELKLARHIAEGHREELPASFDEFHYDGCDGCWRCWD